MPWLDGYVQRFSPDRSPLVITQLPKLRERVVRPVLDLHIHIKQDSRVCLAGKQLDLSGSLPAHVLPL